MSNKALSNQPQLQPLSVAMPKFIQVRSFGKEKNKNCHSFSGYKSSKSQTFYKAYNYVPAAERLVDTSDIKSNEFFS